MGFAGDMVDYSGSLPHVGKVDPGFSIMYWKGITRYLDYSIRYNGIFSDYAKGPSTDNSSSGYANEFEGSLHLHLVADEHVVSPFLSAGVGVGRYDIYWAPYTPLGAGLQFNFFNETYVLLQANYRIALSGQHLDNNTFASLGIMEAINSPKPKTPKPLPPPPVVEVKDRDGDGVPDSLDACPDVAGLARFKGCPDTDGDGIPDPEDKCPNQKGTAKYNGCPIPDTDGDGINDEEDKCPTVAGVARYNGCPIPDRDGDGVNDEVDRCPDVPGTAANQGCPEVKEEVRKKAEYAAQHLYFATGSFRILAKSFKGLNDIAVLMKGDAALKFFVDGYTDNVGRPEKNQVLSENRAGSVKKFLVAKGIDASRIVSAGHGQDQPVADNKTAAGRAKNRRVEFKLNY